MIIVMYFQHVLNDGDAVFSILPNMLVALAMTKYYVISSNIHCFIYVLK